MFNRPATRGPLLLGLLLFAHTLAAAPDLEPIVYRVKVPAPETHILEIEVTVPTGGQDSIELRMARWSPGFYRVEDYAGKIQSLTARTADGALLAVEKTSGNRWRIHADGSRSAIVSYSLLCELRSVTTNWVGGDLGVLNGAATFVTLVENERRPHEIHLELPAAWKDAATALDPAPDGAAHHYRAPDYDTLVDSPIVAGDLDIHPFVVNGSRHLLVDVGERPGWDARRAANDLERIVHAANRLWGSLPFKTYLFLNVFRQGGGGLEHKDSTLLTVNAERVKTPEGYARWLAFVSHEYAHAWNVKRLRPIELGPFDYENEPRTTSLWISEGVTNYYADLALSRAALLNADGFLASLSAQINNLQKQPGRLLQTLEQSSSGVWSNSLSGVNPTEKTVSYYVKGHVAAFLLDAKIRAATGGAKSLDDVMRLALARFGGERGFTSQEFQATAEEIAGMRLGDWFKRAIASTEELNYESALAWFGLRFMTNRAGTPQETSWLLTRREDATTEQRARLRALIEPPMPSPAGSATVEQRAQGRRPPATLIAGFDGLGVGFVGPQGTTNLRQPSDNTLAVGLDHIVQIVNTRTAVFTKKGKRFATTGKQLYGPVPTNNVFRGFGGACEALNNGDAVARYDQLADRWLIVMPTFTPAPARDDQPGAWTAGPTSYSSPIGRSGQPGAAVSLFQPPPPSPEPSPSPSPGPPQPRRNEPGPYSMCYAVSATPDPLGAYYRYEFLRPLFPDYPRPAVWPDGYYVPTSTGDEVIQKHACVADRTKMLRGESATEQCVVMDGVNFLNNVDLEGKRLPPPGAPNIMLAAGGAQLENVLEADAIFAWAFHVDWKDRAKTKVTGPERIAVAPYHYLCDGQLTHCVPQPGTERRLDAQGDKLMARVVYRNLGGRESIVAAPSINTSMGGGGVRFYELQVDKQRRVTLRQQGTYAPDASYRWMPSPALDRNGNIGIGYSFGGTPDFAGQRFAARLANDPLGELTLRESVLAEGESSQSAMRWEDYTQTAVDPGDDCTIWYVGDYTRKDAVSYSTRIGAFRLPGCRGRP